MAPIFHPLPRAEVAEAPNANDGLTNVVVVAAKNSQKFQPAFALLLKLPYDHRGQFIRKVMQRNLLLCITLKVHL